MVIIREGTNPNQNKSAAQNPYEQWVGKAHFADDDHLWLVGEFQDVLPDQKSRVEGYYCGFLGFYEQQSRSDMIDYKILFRWRHDLKHVQVFLFPAPLRNKIQHEDDKNTYDELVIKVNKAAGGANIPKWSYPIVPPPPMATQTLGQSDPPGTSAPPPPPPK